MSPKLLHSCPKCGASLIPGSRFCTSCGDRLDERVASLVDRLRESLGENYEVMGELGQGGFAIVYAVRDRKLSRYLAVKVMRPEYLTSPTAVRRFQRETEYVATLDHPNILSVVFSREENGLVYYAMPRARGKSLRDILRKEQYLSIIRAATVLSDVACGLDHAHQEGLIHRDIKPSNIMVNEQGRAVILDFGIAKALSREETNLSLSGDILGTPSYMSPEQAQGVERIDHRTDICSWGILGFEMLAGRPPYVGETPQSILYQQMHDTPPDLRDLRPETPKMVADAIHRCLARNPDDRFQTMREAASAAGIGGWTET